MASFEENSENVDAGNQGDGVNVITNNVNVSISDSDNKNEDGTPGEPVTQSETNSTGIIGAIVVVVILLGVGFALWRYRRKNNAQPAQQVVPGEEYYPPPPPPQQQQ